MRLPLASTFRRPIAMAVRAASRPVECRAFHKAKADLTSLDKNGLPSTERIDIFIGDPGESYIIFDKSVGATMAAAVRPQASPSLEQVPLTFFHESRCFATQAASYPRITIKQDLPRPNGTSVSPATLWLWGASHSITLDGTEDHEFELASRDSHHQLKGVAELLKDM